MARPVMLGNGALTVGLDEHGLVHDFYYSYVGLENLTTARSVHHKIGIWVNGTFSWVDDGTWNISVNFETDALVSNVRLQNDQLQIELLLTDFVDSDINAFCRQIRVTNQTAEARDVRLFMHQVFQISQAGRADTALFVPGENYILDYKGRCNLLIYGETADGTAYDQFAVGNYGIEGKEGTFRDAEDGELSGSAVEHGGVDSIIRFRCDLAGGSSQDISYWIVAADSQHSAEQLHAQIKTDTVVSRLQTTREWWSDWLSTAANALDGVDQNHLVLAKKSLMLIKAHIDKRGGIIASCDSSIYNYGRDYYTYVWPRDGAYAIWPLIRLGFTEEPKQFFEFCRDVIAPGGYLMHKYQPDRAIGSSWHPMLHGTKCELAIQEDETAVVLYMIGEYFEYSGDEAFVRSLYESFIQPAANFLANFLDEQTNLPHASYDLWEQKFLTNTYTVAVTYQALLVAADLAKQFEYPDDVVGWEKAAETILSGTDVFFDPERKLLRKGYLLGDDGTLTFDNTLDVSSLYGVMMYGYQNQADHLHDTARAVESLLLNQSPSGGAPRYEHDGYFLSDQQYLGNPWFVCTLWMAQYYVRTKQLDKARQLVEWTSSRALPSGVLSEQVSPLDSQPISVAPLVWSHAEYINTVLDLARAEDTADYAE